MLSSIDQVNELLADRLDDLLPDLIGGHASRHEWIAGDSAHGGLGNSLAVVLRGARRGQWFHHAAGVGGDPLGLICYARFNNTDMGGALAWARQFLGNELKPESQAERQARLERRQRQAAAQATADARDERWQRERARRLFFEAQQDWRDTPVWHYLDNRLCGYLARLEHRPRSLRYMPALHNEQLRCDLPAMVAAVVSLTGELIAVHRTWLVKRGAQDDTWDRLREHDTTTYGATHDGEELRGKKVLGAWKGGAIRLWPGIVNGRRGLPWSRLKPGQAITLAEGIETSLAIAVAEPARRVACVLSSGGFASVVLPPAFAMVSIAADRDVANKQTHLALERAKQAIASAERQGEVFYPPVPFDDWCGVLEGVVRHAGTR